MTIMKRIAALSLACAPLTEAMGAGISNHGDTLRLVFVNAREHASHIVTRMHAAAFSRSANDEIKAWVLKNKEALAADILASEHRWVTELNDAYTTCAETQAPAAGEASPNHAPIILYFPLCRNTANFKDAAALLIHESIHHFGVSDESFADGVALAIVRAWEQNALDWQLFGDAQTVRALNQSAAVWTGSEMLVFGGSVDGANGQKTATNDFYAYNPETNAWRVLSSQGAPERFAARAVWTGSQLIVWGGFKDSTTWVNGGTIWDPKTDSWRELPAAAGPREMSSLDNRYMPLQDVAWTGDRLAVWGGNFGRGQIPPGGLYDPLRQSWDSMGGAGAPERFSGHSLTFGDNKLYVWGGLSRNAVYATDGAVYDLATRQWSAMPGNATAPGARTGHTAVWANDRLVVFSGQVKDRGENPSFGSGGVFDPTAGTWKRFNTESVMERTGHQAVWTGGEMLVFGGRSSTFTNFLGDVAAFDPISLTWRSIAKPNGPKARGLHTAVWTGNAMIIWGGSDRYATTSTGGIFRP